MTLSSADPEEADKPCTQVLGHVSAFTTRAHRRMARTLTATAADPDPDQRPMPERMPSVLQSDQRDGREIIMLEYKVTARRLDSHGSEAATKQALVGLDTDMTGRADAFNPAELLLASLAACILKGTDRVIPMLAFSLRGAEGRMRPASSNSRNAFGIDDWFGMVMSRIQRPRMRIRLTALKLCEPSDTCMTAGVLPCVGRTAPIDNGIQSICAFMMPVIAP
jgi:hypothetical protein